MSATQEYRTICCQEEWRQGLFYQIECQECTQETGLCNQLLQFNIFFIAFHVLDVCNGIVSTIYSHIFVLP